MKIEFNKNSTVPFKDVKAGTCFENKGGIYIKLGNRYYINKIDTNYGICKCVDNDGEGNFIASAFNVNYNILTNFDDDVEVRVIDNAVLNIN